MNAPNYGYDAQAAAQADAGLRITETGLYVGTFVQAYHHAADSGAIAINLDFKARDGRTANLSIWTDTKSGDPIDSGIKRLNAIMAILGLPNGIKHSEGYVERWDFDSNSLKKAPGYVFLDLINKPIGIVVQKELYTKTQGSNAGQDGSRVQLIRVCDADTHKTAKEMLENKPAKQIELLLESLGDKDTRNAATPAAPVQQQVVSNGSTGGGSSFVDDIPFGALPSFP